LTLPWIGCFGA
jgi:hypothetical protein